MKLYLASANLDDIRWATGRRLVDGVLTTPGLTRADDVVDERERLRDVARLVDGPVFATVHAVTGDDAYRDGRELARLADNVVVQVPFVEDAIEAIHRLAADGVRVAATLVFSAAQALLASRAGASAVVVAMDDLDASGHDATGVIRDMRAVFDASGSEADIVALRPSNAAQFAACVNARSDGVAVATDVLRTLLVHPLSDRGLDRFLQELSRQHAAWTLV
jgi:transaldolase